MKKFITFMMIVFMVGVTTAKSMFDGMSKEQLADYDIVIVNKKTGKEVGRMSRAEYKVVKIGSGDSEELKAKLAKQEQISNDLHEAVVSLHKKVVKSQEPYNSLILHAGAGKDGLDRSYNNDVYEISEKEKAVLGVTGCRTYGTKGICASAFTNSLLTLGLKLDFK